MASLDAGDWVRCYSSNVWAYRYCADVARLDVEFNSGAVYHYFGVSHAVARGLDAAGSKGRYVWDALRGRYHEERVPSAETYAGPVRQAHLRETKSSRRR